MQSLYYSLLPEADSDDRYAISKTLERFGARALALAKNNGIRIRPLVNGQRYCDASRALMRLGIDVDSWPAPPAGLFVLEEQTVYLKSRSRMTIAHEFGHALDCALGGGVYRSSADLEIRRAFSSARSFVTPYAATGLDEYFAEAVRAFVECNDEMSPWPHATRERLERVDPIMFGIVEAAFAKLPAA